MTSRYRPAERSNARLKSSQCSCSPSRIFWAPEAVIVHRSGYCPSGHAPGPTTGAVPSVNVPASVYMDGMGGSAAVVGRRVTPPRTAVNWSCGRAVFVASITTSSFVSPNRVLSPAWARKSCLLSPDGEHPGSGFAGPGVAGVAAAPPVAKGLGAAGPSVDSSTWRATWIGEVESRSCESVEDVGGKPKSRPNRNGAGGALTAVLLRGVSAFVPSAVLDTKVRIAPLGRC